jgi:hypothetical protein
MSSRRFFTLVITLVWIGIAVTRAMAQEITVTQAVVCQEIVDRMPVGAGDVIPAGTDRVFCFTQIDGIQAGGRDYPQLVLSGIPIGTVYAQWPALILHYSSSLFSMAMWLYSLGRRLGKKYRIR